MYTLTKIYAKVVNNGVRWSELDLATALATEVHRFNQTFGQTRMVLTHPQDPDKFFLFDFFNDGLDYVNKFIADLTLQQWFTALGDTALPTKTFSQIKTVQANFADAMVAEFKVEAVVPGGQADKSIPWAARTDLLITKDGLTGQTIEKNALVSVNGYLHRTYSSSVGLYAMQGGRSMTVANMNTLGILSMANLGGCTVVPITESMLGGLPDGDNVLETPVYVSVPGFDWSNSSAMLVLLGHLIPLGNVFKAVGTGLFEINLSRYPYLDHFLTAEKYMDLTQIRSVVDKKLDAPTMISVKQAQQRDFLLQMLTISQSFVVVVNSPDVYFDKTPLEVTQHPCVFLHHEAVTHAIVNHDGRLINYVQEDDGERWVIKSPPDGTHDRRRMFENRWRNQNAVDAVRTNLKRVQMGRPSVLAIRRDTFV